MKVNAEMASKTHPQKSSPHWQGEGSMDRCSLADATDSFWRGSSDSTMARTH
jgi:hypothetical protein